MELELRTILIIVGFIVIGVVAWDGWRRSRDKLVVNIDKKLNESFNDSKEREFDSSGFDQDGVSAARLVNKTSSASAAQETYDHAQKIVPTFNESPDPFVAPKSATSVPQEPELVLSINLFSRKGHRFNGPGLLQQLLSLGLRFGDMGIFHRYTKDNDSGDVLFSLANAYTPGTFDLENMESFTTEGLCMFLTIPGPRDPKTAFENMIETANKLSHSLGGALFDADQSALTPQTIAHYREKIAEVVSRSQVPA